MKVFQEIILCTILLGTFYACASANEEGNSSINHGATAELIENSPKMRGKQDDSALPKSKKVKISIEGMEEEISVNLYESEKDFPMPFHVYVPSKYKPTQEKMGENVTVAFAYGPAKLKIISLPATISDDDADKIAKDLVKVRGKMKKNEIKEEKIYYLADEGQEIYTTEVRTVNGRFFIIAHEVPVEYADGFYPRAELITENIVWKK